MQILFLIVLCAAFSFIVIAPLWLFASKAPRVYSALVAAAALAAVIVFAARQAKRAGLKKTIFFLLKTLAAVLTFFVSLGLLFKYQRLLALLALIAGAALFRVISVFSDRQNPYERRAE